MQPSFRHLLALVICAAAGCARPATRPVTRPAPAGAVRFLLVNDVYVIDTLRDGTGGVARVAALHRGLERDDRVLFVLAGDVLSPSLLSKWYGGRQMVEGFNAARLDYATFGNHEFELDRDTLIARIGASRFRWLSSNCTLADGTAFPNVRPWDTVTVGGVKIGLFGLTLTGDYRRYVRCTNPDSAARGAISALRAAGASLVVGLTHQNLSADSALLAREPELDLILGGHEHEAHKVDIGGRIVVKADANARSAQIVMLSREDEGWRTDSRLAQVDRSLLADSATAEVARAWSDSLARRLGPERAIGRAAAPIDARDALSRSHESPLGDLVADGIRFGTRADVALINAGALRLDDVLQPGAITNYQLESIFLFADETRVVTFPLSGARLRELLEHSVSDAAYGRGGFLQVSGVRFRYDPARPSGARVVGELARPDGRPIGPAEQLRVAFNSFPACLGGDQYRVPEAAAACVESAKGPRAVDLLLSHITTRLGGKIEPPTAGRIVRAGQ